MTPERDDPEPRRKPDWVLAILAGTAVASVIGAVLVWSAWTPAGPDEAQVAAWRQQSLAACRADPDLVAHLGIDALPYHRLKLWSQPISITIQRDGLAELQVYAPEAERGNFTLRIPPADFARLAQLTATLQFERRAIQSIPDPGEVGSSLLEVYRDGILEFSVNSDSIPGEFAALESCLRSLSSDTRWVRDTSADAIIVD
jgi:hypothetical protein